MHWRDVRSNKRIAYLCKATTTLTGFETAFNISEIRAISGDSR